MIEILTRFVIKEKTETSASWSVFLINHLVNIKI